MEHNDYKLLKQINSPDDLKKFTEKDLVQISNELREFIIDAVSKSPGHFGASLGVVELTVALHYVYNTPYDRIVWDVGHQAYGHKILTGRRDNFHTLRKLNGVSGFPNIFESKYDAFGVGHSSTSISAALGMATAKDILYDKNRKIVAVIGDGSMTAGMAFEALNNAGIMKKDMLVILNDNNMAIDPNVGALSEYLLDIATSKTYNKLKDEVWNMLAKFNKIAPKSQSVAQKIDNAIKAILLKHSNMFEAMQFRYFGPVDGHDVLHLVQVLKDLRDIPGPKLLHVITTKGKGYKYAEENQTAWHATSTQFDVKTGKALKIENTPPQGEKFQKVFGETIVELAEMNPKIVGITPAMPSGSSLDIMIKKMPDRAFDVGIAEQHAVTFSAGMAIQGLKPFCNIYSTFMQRAYDQVIHDVALQNLNVVFCLDRGGLVGADGATHHGAFDLAYMRIIPNMIVAAPMDEVELRNMMYTAQLKDFGPFTIRYPRGKGSIADWKQKFEEIPIGKARTLTQGTDIAILSIGAIGAEAAKAVIKLTEQGYSPAHYDMRFVKPLDEELLHQIFNQFDKIITVEDGSIKGGFGSAILEFAADNSYQAKIKRLGIPDKFIDHGTQQELYKLCGYDTQSIFETAVAMIENVKVRAEENEQSKNK